MDADFLNLFFKVFLAIVFFYFYHSYVIMEGWNELLLTVPKQLGNKFSIHIAKIIRAELSKVKNRRRLKSIVCVLEEKSYHCLYPF